MKKSIVKVILFAIIINLFIVVNSGFVYAADAQVSVSSVSANVGDQVSMTVTVNSSTAFSDVTLYFSYDSNILGFDSSKNSQLSPGTTVGAGQIKINEGFDNTGVKTASFTINFTALAAGSSSIQLLTDHDNMVTDLYGTDGDEMNIVPSSGTVTVTSPTPKSTNNNLSSLKVAAVDSAGNTSDVVLTPAFSASTLSYSTSVPSGVKKLVLSVTTEDTTATTVIKGLLMDPGKNTTTIKVTSESGEVKTYTINTVVGDEETTQETTSGTVTPVEGGITVTVDGQSLIVKSSLEGIEIPEGFEATTYTYKENEIQVAKGLSKGLIIMYLTDANQENGAYYIYNETSDSFYKMVNIQLTNKMYTIVKSNESIVIPSGYTLSQVTIGDQQVEAWVNPSDPDFCLVYAMNWDGESNLYMYDMKEQTMQRYKQQTTDTNSDSSQLITLQNKINSLNDKYDSEVSLKWKLLMVLAVICVILIITIVVLTIKQKGFRRPEEETETDDDGYEVIDVDSPVHSSMEEAATKEDSHDSEQKDMNEVVSADHNQTEETNGSLSTSDDKAVLDEDILPDIESDDEMDFIFLDIDEEEDTDK